MVEGEHLDSEADTPQEGCASAILANVYLHCVLDLWFDIAVQMGRFRERRT